MSLQLTRVQVLARASEIYIINAIDNGSIVRKGSVGIGCKVAEVPQLRDRCLFILWFRSVQVKKVADT
jgi:hypothetical protein